MAGASASFCINVNQVTTHTIERGPVLGAAIAQVRLWRVPAIERARDLDKGGGTICTR